MATRSGCEPAVDVGRASRSSGERPRHVRVKGDSRKDCDEDRKANEACTGSDVAACRQCCKQLWPEAGGAGYQARVR
jgi:hypothetical protein